MIWRGQIIGYRLLSRRRKITLGPSKRATFVTPPLDGQTKFLLLQPRRDGYVLHLASELRGDLTVGGTAMSVADVASRDVDLARGDKAKLVFTDGSDLRIELRWVDPPDYIPRPRFRDPQMVQITVGTQHHPGRALPHADAALGEDRAEAAAGARRQPRRQDRGPQASSSRKKVKNAPKEEEAEKSKKKEGQMKRPRRRPAASDATTPPPRTPSSPRGQRRPARQGPEGRHSRHHRARRRHLAPACRSCSPRATTSSRRSPAWRAPGWSSATAPGA